LSSVRCSAEGGVQVYPVERHTLLAGRHGKLIFGYGHLSPAEIALGVARLAQLGGAELAMAQIGAWQTGSWSCRATRPDTDALKRKRIW